MDTASANMDCSQKLHRWVHDHKVPRFGPHFQVQVRLFKISEVYSKQIKEITVLKTAIESSIECNKLQLTATRSYTDPYPPSVQGWQGFEEIWCTLLLDL